MPGLSASVSRACNRLDRVRVGKWKGVPVEGEMAYLTLENSTTQGSSRAP